MRANEAATARALSQSLTGTQARLRAFGIGLAHSGQRYRVFWLSDPSFGWEVDSQAEALAHGYSMYLGACQHPWGLTKELWS